MKLGELVDAIRRVEEAEHELFNARKAVMHGGNEFTMKTKREDVTFCESVLRNIRDEELPL